MPEINETKIDDINPSTELREFLKHHNFLKSDGTIKKVDRANQEIITQVAIEENALDILRELVERNLIPDFTAYGSDGYTVLHAAAIYGKLDLVTYLIDEQGMNPAIKTRTSNKTPFDLIRDDYDNPTRTYLRRHQSKINREIRERKEKAALARAFDESLSTRVPMRESYRRFIRGDGQHRKVYRYRIDQQPPTPEREQTATEPAESAEVPKETFQSRFESFFGNNTHMLLSLLTLCIYPFIMASLGYCVSGGELINAENLKPSVSVTLVGDTPSTSSSPDYEATVPPAIAVTSALDAEVAEAEFKIEELEDDAPDAEAVTPADNVELIRESAEDPMLCLFECSEIQSLLGQAELPRVAISKGPKV